MKTSVLRGQDALDQPVDIRPNQDITDGVITLTDRSTEISGKILAPTGQPAPEYFIIVFSADSASWIPQSRRIQQVRPAHDGKFTFRNLPPGDYLIGAVTDVEQGQWFDPEFLKQLVTASIKIALADGEKKVQDIRLEMRVEEGKLASDWA